VLFRLFLPQARVEFSVIFLKLHKKDFRVRFTRFHLTCLSGNSRNQMQINSKSVLTEIKNQFIFKRFFIN
ncbi:CLUMA_CG015921, isoform A, partial [Clunio marinus]